MRNCIAVRTLVIDDDPSVCRKVAGWLAGAAYDVVSFTDPSEGLRHVSGAPCDLALVDLRLPKAEGSEVIASLRAACPQMRVVAMSAFPDVQQVIAALRAGARDVLEKPIQQPSLLAALDRQLAELGIVARNEAEFHRRLGTRMRALRREGSRTVQQVASDCGISAAQLSQIENGKTGTSAWTLARICAALRVTPSTLFEGL